jgi:hypothetical protein
MAVSVPQTLIELRKSQRLHPHLLLSNNSKTNFKAVYFDTCTFGWKCCSKHKRMRQFGFKTTLLAAEAYLEHRSTQHNHHCIEYALCVTAGPGGLTTI